MQLIGLQLWTPVKWDVLKKSNLRQTELDQGSSLHHPNVCIFTTMVKTNVWLMNTAMMQARLNLPEISTFSFRTNTTDTPLNPHYPKIFEKKTRIETDEIVNHLSIYESTCICTCQKGLWDTKEMYTSCYNLNVWYQLNNLLSQYDYFNVYYGSSLLKTLIAYNLNTCNKKHFYWEIASHCPGFLFISQWWERQNRGDPDYVHITKRNS